MSFREFPSPLEGQGQLFKRSADKQGEGSMAGQLSRPNPSDAPSP